MSSLLSIIGLPELTRKANELTVTVYRPLEIYAVLVGAYLVIIWYERVYSVRVKSLDRFHSFQIRGVTV
jgi:ABC-type amino acid transport system permease subunit